MRLDFVELRVSDWRRSAAWYHEVLGLTPVLRDEPNGFVLLAAGGCRVALKAGEPRPGVLLAFEVADLAAWVARLGTLVEGEVVASAEGYRRARLRDPDGYEIILFEEVPRVR